MRRIRIVLAGWLADYEPAEVLEQRCRQAPLLGLMMFGL
jgi:hypothetical protein